MSIFYVYVYLDPRKPGSFDYGEFHFDYEPFYVGKGQNDSWVRHLILAEGHINSYKLNKIRKIQSLGLEPKIIKYEENLTEQEAFDLEKRLIKAIGRSDLVSGPLTNLIDGGRGGLSNPSKETRQKLRYGHLNQKSWCRGLTKENDSSVARQAEKMKGRTKENDSGVARMAEKKRGRTKENDLGYAKVSEKMKGKEPWNKGLTKDIDERVASQAAKLRGRTKDARI